MAKKHKTIEQLQADALVEFSTQYPSTTSADLQTFILGMLKGIEMTKEVMLNDILK